MYLYQLLHKFHDKVDDNDIQEICNQVKQINPYALINSKLFLDIAPRFYPIHHRQILEGLSKLDFNLIDSRKKADIQLSKHVDDFGVRQFLLKNLYWVCPGVLGLRLK